MREISSVRLFEQADPRVLPQFEIHLAIAGIDGNDACCPTLQQTIGKSACGCANVYTDFPGHINLPVRESVFELQSPTTDILQVLLKETNNAVGVNLSSSLFDFLVIHQDFSRKNQGLRALA